MVATVTRLSEAASTVHYFEADGYYAKNDAEHRRASRWHGKGIEALGLHGPVKPRRFEEILSGRIPGTSTRLGRLRDGKHEHRPGLDITFSAPKSVSLEALVHAAPKASARIIRAHDEAVTATLDFIESELLETRGWDPATRKRPRIKGHGLVAATFRHYASRNLDPQLHTHSVVANMTRNAEGEWRSADFIKLERAKLLIGAHYRSELKRRLEALGYATEQTMVGSVPGFEIAGYDRATLKAFSTRRAEALAWVKERNLDDRSAAVMQQAVLYTRKRKDEPSRKELSNIWQVRMAELAPRNRRVSRGRSASHTRLDRERWHLERRDAINRQSPSALHAVRRAVEHLEERRTVFTANMLRALTLAPGRWTLSEIDGAIGRLREEGHLVEATAARSDLAFVTERAVTAERAVLRWLKKESDAPGRFMIDADRVHRHLEAGTVGSRITSWLRWAFAPDSFVPGQVGSRGNVVDRVADCLPRQRFRAGIPGRAGSVRLHCLAAMDERLCVLSGGRRRGPPGVRGTGGPGTVQIRWNVSLSGEAYVTTKAWTGATLERCPLHPEGGCTMGSHGTYVRYTRWGDAHIPRWYCREGHTTFSLLADCFASRLRGTLNDLEDSVAAVDEAGSVAPVAEAVCRRVPVVDAASARRRLRRHAMLVRLCLTAVISLLPAAFPGVAPGVVSMRSHCGAGCLLMLLRGTASRHLATLPHPLGFLVPGCSVTDRVGSIQHSMSRAPPAG